MRTNLLLLFKIISTFLLLVYGKYNVITNETIQLKIGEIAFFESPNYPEFQLLESFFHSNLSFYLNQQKVKNVKLIISLTYFYSRTNKAITENYILNDYVYSVRSLWGTNNPYHAVQGYLIFEEAKNEACPLEVISSEEPFHFMDETYILYLQSVYQNLSDSSTMFTEDTTYISCKWKFIAPEGYGFKIVLTLFEISPENSFSVRNTTDILINERSAKVFHPYYNSDKSIEIYLSKNEPFFQLYISLVENNPIITDANCTLIETVYNTYKTISWISGNFMTQGYQNNIKCTYNFTISPNTQISFTGRATLEENVDVLKYSTGNNVTGIINTGVVDNKFLLFAPENLYVYFEFITDGSISDGGFDAVFDLITTTFVSTIPGGILCNNLHCNFTIQSCDTSLTHISISYDDYNNGSNYFLFIYSNNFAVFDITYAIKYGTHYEIFVNSTNTNIIEVIVPTYPSVITCTIVSHSFEPPIIHDHVVLSTSNSEFTLDIGITKATAFELSNTLSHRRFLVYGIGLTYSVNGIWPLFFNATSFTSSLLTNINCITFDTIFTYKCEFKSPTFTVYPGIDKAYSTYMAVRVSGRGEDNSGCVFEENIFIPKNEMSLSIAGIATKDGTCKLKVLLFYGYIITSLWTTANERNVQIFAGNDEKFLLLEFNSQPMNQWTQIGLFSAFYVIKISNGDAVFLRLTQIPSYTYDFIQNPTTSFRSIVASPQYGSYKSLQGSSFLVYSIGETPIKITTLYSTLSENYQFFLQDTSTRFQFFINNTGDTIVFKNRIISLNCVANPSMEKDAGAVVLIESLDKI